MPGNGASMKAASRISDLFSGADGMIQRIPLTMATLNLPSTEMSQMVSGVSKNFPLILLRTA